MEKVKKILSSYLYFGNVIFWIRAIEATSYVEEEEEDEGAKRVIATLVSLRSTVSQDSKEAKTTITLPWASFQHHNQNFC